MAERVLFRAVVEEVIYDPLSFNWQHPTFFQSAADPSTTDLDLNTPDRIAQLGSRARECPQNSLLVRVTTDGEYKLTGQLRLCYPLFPPHLQMPVKVGESVWVIGEHGDTADKILYWMCRIPESRLIDDVNYTYSDRRLTVSSDELTNEELADGVVKIPEFPEGLDGESWTMPFNQSQTAMIRSSYTAPMNSAEVVPRFLKRPGDLVIQGSNNTLISLGQDRGLIKSQPIKYSHQLASNANIGNLTSGARPPTTVGHGTIDLVTGRGRYTAESFTTGGGVGQPGFRTAPLTILNQRAEIEADKNPTANNLETHKFEGDPDFGYDASRIYISTRTDVDFNFELNFPDPVKYKGTADDTLSGHDLVISDGSSMDYFDSAIALKSNEIRVIARSLTSETGYATSPPEGDAPIPTNQGSIKLIKEGVPDSEDGNGRATIQLMPDGTIYIDGPKIVIGSGIEKGNGEGTQLYLGGGDAANTQPIVMGTELVKLLSAIVFALDTHIHPTGVGPSGPRIPVASEAAPHGWTNTDASASSSPLTDLSAILSKIGKTR